MYYEDSLDGEAPLGAPAPTLTKPAQRPANVPEKFWDAAAGQIRVDALLRSYLDLERHQSGMIKPPGANAPDAERAAFHRALGVPDSPDGYDIATQHDLLCSCPEVNARLHAEGFTPAQAQLVYDLAHERVLPLLEASVGDAERQRAIDQLTEHFGGEARWTETAHQLSAWGKANLPPEVYQALSASPQGVKAMQRLMASGEPALGRAGAAGDEPASEEDLKKMMQDPRYWKTRDPKFIDKVSAGFRRLYGE